MAGFCVTRVVRDWTSVDIQPNGESFGAMVEEAIRTALKRGEELQTLTIELGDGDWDRLARMFHGVPEKRK